MKVLQWTNAINHERNIMVSLFFSSTSICCCKDHMNIIEEDIFVGEISK